MREEAIAAAANKVASVGGATALWGGLAANDIATFVGAAAALIGVAIQFYYKRKADRREAEYHATRMAELREDGQGAHRG